MPAPEYLTRLSNMEEAWDRLSDYKNQFVQHNLKLVVAIAKDFRNMGIPFQDLIQEGNIGLIRAVEGFDPAQGARFSTYASWWIKQAIKRTLINAVQPIHIPAYMVELIAKWKETIRRLEDELGRQPTTQELATAMEVPVKKLQIIRRAMKALHSSPQAPVSEDGETVDFSDLFEDFRHEAPEDKIINLTTLSGSGNYYCVEFGDGLRSLSAEGTVLEEVAAACSSTGEEEEGEGEGGGEGA